MNIHGICHVYARYVWYIVLKAKHDLLQLSRFNIIFSSTVALVCSIEVHINTWKWKFNIHCIYVVYSRHILLPYIYLEFTWYAPTLYLVGGSRWTCTNHGHTCTYMFVTFFLFTYMLVKVCTVDVLCTDGYIHFMKCTDIVEWCTYTDVSF